MRAASLINLAHLLHAPGDLAGARSITASALHFCGGVVAIRGCRRALAASTALPGPLPMPIGFTRHGRGRGFAVLGQNRGAMAERSIVGSFTGGHVLGLVPSLVLLAIILVLLAVNSLA